MLSWPKPQKLRQTRRLPRLRLQQLVLLVQEQHHRLLADRDLLAGVKRQRRTARIFGAPQSLQSQIANLESRINDARVAELADAPDLGLQNHRFQSVASRFKTTSLHDRKTPNFRKPSTPRITSREPVILAQILVHGRTRVTHICVY